MSEELKTEVTNNEETKAPEKKKKGIDEGVLEIITAIFLGVTALLTAWATWIGSLHGGNQSTNYTQSNNMSAMGNSMYNEAAQAYMQDMLLWNTINDYIFERDIALENGKQTEADMIDEKIDYLMSDNCTEEFQEAIDWAFEEGTTPFAKEGYVESYFAEANSVLEEADALLEEGKKDNSNGDAYGLVTVIYSVVLFLLGIIGIFKRLPNRAILLIIALVFLVVATIYMLTIPMPTNFSLLSFFVH